MEQHEFQAESRKLLDMMIHSIYTEKEIFLRELISNASDALDKLRYLAINGECPEIDSDKLAIRIRIEKDKRYLYIIDNGIGMNKEEMIRNLGTIANSGTAKFQEKNKMNSSLIGQFGVGFYSAFMVADRVTVISKKYDEPDGWRWDSNGIDGFTIKPFDKKQIGTQIVLHIREDKEENDEYSKYLREYTIYKLIKKYSDYIIHPIKLYMPHPEIKEKSDPQNPEFEEKFSYEVINSQIPIWQKNKKEVSREELNTFYKEHFGENKDPQDVLFFNAEGTVTYRALLYFPSVQPRDYGTDDFKPGLEMYSANVKIMDSCIDILPEEYNFIQGIIDTVDISLNISREMLQKNRAFKQISKNLEKKVRNELLEKLHNHREEYEKFHAQFGHHLKVCAMDEYGKKKDTLGDLLLFYSEKKQKLITLDEYIADMPDHQKYIYYASGDSISAISNIPQIEIIREHNMDILYFLDQADIFVAQMFATYKNKPFRSAIYEEADLEKEEETKKNINQELFDFVKEALKNYSLDEVKGTNRLKNHPVCLSSGKGITYEMESYFRSISPDMPMRAKLILELNLEHQAIQILDSMRKSDPKRASKYCIVLYNQARMIAGLPIQDPLAYTDLICSLF